MSPKYKNKKVWTLHLSDTVIHQFRLHLSWVVKIREPNIFQCTRLQIGTTIIQLFKTDKMLNKLIRIIREKEIHESYVRFHMEDSYEI